MRIYLLKGYLALVTFALFVSGAVQVLDPQWLASEGTWALAPGWQREIAFWNFSFVAMIIILLRSSNTYALRVMVVGVIVLTGLLGTNHLYSVLTEPVSFWHHALIVLNYAGTIGGVMVLIITNKSQD